VEPRKRIGVRERSALRLGRWRCLSLFDRERKGEIHGEDHSPPQPPGEVSNQL